jgi:SAM-dependent methyltransferase
MTARADVKRQVQEFYDQVGWQEVYDGSDGQIHYQNARYEDLRPVSHEYIHRCHLRVARHLKPSGRYLLDAGSGPIQYPEYLEYSRGYQRRVCADISFLALQEARKRIGQHGLFVVTDVANLPFKPGVFDGVVSLHTIHHLPEDEHLKAYSELNRVLAPECAAVVVNGWPDSQLMSFFNPLVRLSSRLRGIACRISGKQKPPIKKRSRDRTAGRTQPENEDNPKGTFTNRHDVAWINNEVGRLMPVEILVWRSVSVRFLRNLIHPALGGRLWLRLLFWLEEKYPHYFGENGQYPLIVIRKKGHSDHGQPIFTP